MGRALIFGWVCLLAFSSSPADAQDVSGAGRGFDLVGKNFVAVQVRDDSAAADWYKRLFSLEEVNHLAAEGRYSIRILAGEGLVVELINEASAVEPPERHFGLFKAGFYVDDLDAAYAWLESNGVDVDDQIFTDEAVGVRTFVFRDLEGNRLQLFIE